MKWLKTWLLNQKDGMFSFEETLIFDSRLIKTNKYLLDLKDVKINGQGFYDKAMDIVSISFDLEGTMIVPCSLSLEPVDYPFKTSADVKYTFSPNNQDDEVIETKNFEVDITPYVWEVINFEVPFKVTKKDAKYLKKGENWEVKTEDELKEEMIDPRLAKLKDYFKK